MKKTTTIMKIEQLTGTLAIPVKFRAYGKYQWGWAFVKEFSLENARYKWTDDKEIISMEPYHTIGFAIQYKTTWKITFNNQLMPLPSGFNYRTMYVAKMSYKIIEDYYNKYYLPKIN